MIHFGIQSTHQFQPFSAFTEVNTANHEDDEQDYSLRPPDKRIRQTVDVFRILTRTTNAKIK
jgi:hypothetical protein